MREFIDFASSHGLIINHLALRKITRCPTVTHKSKRNGAFYFDGEFGWVQNWEINDSPLIWKSDSVKDSQELRRRVTDSQKEYRIEREKIAIEAAKKAKWILSQCSLEISPYLARKGFPDMRANVWQRDNKSFLVIPMHKDGKLVGCQLIDDDGNKIFLRGQVTKGAYFKIGVGQQVFFVEGYASGLSLQKILQAIKISHSIIVAFSAGNIANMTKSIKGFIVADNDKSFTGERVAKESGCRWWMPPAIGHDINDMMLDAGLLKTSLELKKAIYSHDA